ncbi:hypothetical protein GCM10027347_59430 [Larkinella harenae]
MDIIFQSGEFISDDSMWGDLFVTITGTTLAGIVTVWVYFNGLDQNKLNEDQKKQRFETDRLVYFTAVLDKIMDIIGKQIEQLDIFTNEIDEKPFELAMLNTFPTHDIERLSSRSDHAEFYHAFSNRDGSGPDSLKSFSIIYSKIDYFDAQIKVMNDHWKLAMKQEYDRRTNYRDSIMAVKNAYDDLIKKLINDDRQKGIARELAQLSILYTAVYEKDPANLTTEHTQLILPLIGLIKDFRGEPDFYLLYSKAVQAKFNYEALIYNNQKVVSYFKSYRSELAEHLQDLKKHTPILEKYRNPVKEEPLHNVPMWRRLFQSI